MLRGNETSSKLPVSGVDSLRPLIDIKALALCRIRAAVLEIVI